MNEGHTDDGSPLKDAETGLLLLNRLLLSVAFGIQRLLHHF